jgi:hypothetical protein
MQIQIFILKAPRVLTVTVGKVGNLELVDVKVGYAKAGI